MDVIIKIPAQPATSNEERLAALSLCFRDGSLLLTGRDAKKPAQFTLKPADNFPWGVFLDKLLVAWQLGDYSDIPLAFRPQKRIPQFVIDGFPNESVPNRLKILATLRSQGYFLPLPAPGHH